MQRSLRKVAPPTTLALAALSIWAAPISTAESDSPISSLAAGPAAAAALAANVADHDDAADYVWNEADVRAITLTGSGATSSAAGVTISGSTVTITQAGTYRATGSLANGRIVVNSTGTGVVRVILNGVTIANSTGAAVDIQAADEAMVVLAAGTTNRLSDATTYSYPSGVTEPDAALFSQADLTLTGTGSLTVQGNAYDGIASKDGLIVNSGTITVTAKDDGIRGKDYLVIDGGTLNVTATGDGLKATNDTDATAGYVCLTGGTATVTATGDAVSAETDVISSGGTLTARSGGGSTVAPGDNSGKGLKAGVSVVISDGQIALDSSDDAVNSDATVTVDGGTVTAATGDDGLHAESTLSIAAGTVNVTKSYEGIEGLKVLISGGSVSAVATDDAFNASEAGLPDMQVAPNAAITVSGGTVVADGGTDGLDSNGTLNLTGGVVVVKGSATRGGGEGGLDSNGSLTITGGTVLSTGVSATTSTLPSSGQGWVSYTFSASQPAGTIVHLATTSGTQVMAFRSTKAFRGVVFSSTSISRGTSYDIYTGGSVSGTAVGGILYLGSGSLTGATKVATVTAGTSSSTGGGGGGGMGL
jgi:hypothetical protein